MAGLRVCAILRIHRPCSNAYSIRTDLSNQCSDGVRHAFSCLPCNGDALDDVGSIRSSQSQDNSMGNALIFLGKWSGNCWGGIGASDVT
eukprot:143537-Amphidinium_carterae.1